MQNLIGWTYGKYNVFNGIDELNSSCPHKIKFDRDSTIPYFIEIDPQKYLADTFRRNEKSKVCFSPSFSLSLRPLPFTMLCVSLAHVYLGQIKDPLGKDGTMFPHWAFHHDNWVGSDAIRILDRLKEQKSYVLRLVLRVNTLSRT